MTKLHELLAAEKTPMSAWNAIREETIKKFKNADHFYHGHSRSLSMIEGSPANEAEERKSREEKPVPTTVHDTLDYALNLFAKSEDLQMQKNSTNRVATADVMFRGSKILTGLPVDELLGLESRLAKLREVLEAMPTLDATKHWREADQQGARIWEVQFPEQTTKTEKTPIPIVMAAATDKHPAQVQVVTKDVVVGINTIVRRSGEVTASQKAEAMLAIDELTVEIKKARMRANETVVSDEIPSVGNVVKDLIMSTLMHF